MVEGDDSFKRPGAVPFKWEVRPGVPKTRPGDDYDDDHPSLHLQPPSRLAPLRLKPFPPSESRRRPVSPFAPPSSFKLKSPPPSDSDSHCSAPPIPSFRFSSLRAGGALPRCFFPTSLFGWKKSKSGVVKKTGLMESSSSSSESENLYETASEDSRQGSVSSRWGSPKWSFSSRRGSPKWSFSSRRGSPLKRTVSDLSTCDKNTIVMMAHSRLG